MPAVSARPAHLPRYRLLTGPDDDQFCRRVSEALDLGYVLHEGPALTVNGSTVIAGQAVVWPDDTSETLRSLSTLGG